VIRRAFIPTKSRKIRTTSATAAAQRVIVEHAEPHDNTITIADRVIGRGK
jgi:hypothetical protein